MNNTLYDSFLEDWIPKQADIIADLEYNRNLADHLVTTEVMYMKFGGLLKLGVIADENLHKWQVLGFSILSLQHSIYNIIPDFPSKQRGQLLALSKEVVKDERFHNDVILSRGDTLSEDELLKKLRSYHIMIKDAIITSDKTLKIILNNPIADTISQTATFLSRDIDSHGVKLEKLILYDALDAIITADITGTQLFVKPL